MAQLRPPRGSVVVFDLETGGLSAGKHPIIQIAAIAVDGSWNEIEGFEMKLRFREEECDREALAKNRYDPVTWDREAVSQDHAMRGFGDFLRRHSAIQRNSKAGKPYSIARLCGHNARFDCGHLEAWFKAAQQFCPAAVYEPLCTLELARWCVSRLPEGSAKPRSGKLEDLCSWLGVPLAEAHDAFADVRATSQVARILWASIDPATVLAGVDG